MGIYVKFHHNHSANMVISRDPGWKFRKFLFLPNFILNIRKITGWGKMTQEQKSYWQKAKIGAENIPPPPRPVLIRLNGDNKYIVSVICKMTEFLVDNIYVRFSGITYLLGLVDSFFNRQFASLWEETMPHYWLSLSYWWPYLVQ